MPWVMGKMVVEGEKTLRFSPKYPQLLPQRSTVEDILENSQRYFYALKLEKTCSMLSINDTSHLDKREISDAENEYPLSFLSSTYIPNEHRIRDTSHVAGHRVITFSQILKYNVLPAGGYSQCLFIHRSKRHGMSGGTRVFSQSQSKAGRPSPHLPCCNSDQ